MALILTIGIVLFFISCGAWSYRDAKKNLAGEYEKIKHGRELKFKILTTLPSFYVLLQQTKYVWPYWNIVVVILLFIFAWWFWFDGLMNVFRKKFFFFKGTNDPLDANVDNKVENWPYWLLINVKSVLFVGFSILYYLCL